MAAELWADEREVVASAYESELQPEESERGDLALTLRGLGPHTAGGAEDVWVRLDVRFALSGVPAASGLPDFAAEDVEAEVLNARGMDEDTAVEMLAAARAEALDEGCAEPPGVCLAWASALVEALMAANEAAPAEGDCSVCLCPLRDEDDDEPEAVVRVSSCMHRFHRACIVRWWTTAADAALAEDISRRNPTHTPAAPRCPVCKTVVPIEDVRKILGDAFADAVGVEVRTGAGAKTPEEAALAVAAAQEKAAIEAAAAAEKRAGGESEASHECAVIGEASDVERPAMVHGEPLLERKSTFQAHVAMVRSQAEVEAAMAYLYESHLRIKRATHNMLAYRIRSESGGIIADHDDDGEAASGGRLAHLLQVTQAENVLVVVSRWFGGVLLGPSRFTLINKVARELLVAEGIVAKPSGKRKGGK